MASCNSSTEQYIRERIRYSNEWVDVLTPEVSAYPQQARDRILSSAWALDVLSPLTGIVFTGAGFDDSLGVAWVSIESDGTLVDGDSVWVNNTIVTTGIMPHNGLETQTSGQMRVRQVRIKFRTC